MKKTLQRLWYCKDDDPAKRMTLHGDDALFLENIIFRINFSLKCLEVLKLCVSLQRLHLIRAR